jgi:hypothetical protein
MIGSAKGRTKRILMRSAVMAMVFFVLTASQSMTVYAVIAPPMEMPQARFASQQEVEAFAIDPMGFEGAVSFAPATAPIVGPIIYALKQALASTLLGAGGVAAANQASWDTNPVADSLLSYLPFGSNDVIVKPALQKIFDMVTSLGPTGTEYDEPMPTRYSVRDPVTGEQRYAARVDLQSITDFMIETGMFLNDFIGPIDMTGAELAWGVGNPFGVHVPPQPVMNPIIEGFYRGVPIVQQGFINLPVEQRIAIMRGMTTNAMVSNYTRNGVEMSLAIDGVRVDPAWGHLQLWGARDGGTSIQMTQRNMMHPIIGFNQVQNHGLIIERTSHLTGILRAAITGYEIIHLGQPRAFAWNTGSLAINGEQIIFGGLIVNAPSRPALDLSLSPTNILTNTPAAVAAVKQISGAENDDDFVYIWWPQTPEEANSMLASTGNPAAVAIIPKDWVVDDDDPPIVGPGTGTGTQTGSTPITQQWMDDVTRNLEDINTGVGALAAAVAVPTELNFRNETRERMITTVFPFSIPFSFGRAITSLRATPQAPRFEVNFSGTIFGDYVWVLDMGMFESVAQVIRWAVWISFFVGLMLLTNKVIRW